MNQKKSWPHRYNGRTVARVPGAEGGEWLQAHKGAPVPIETSVWPREELDSSEPLPLSFLISAGDALSSVFRF